MLLFLPLLLLVFFVRLLLLPLSVADAAVAIVDVALEVVREHRARTSC